MVNFQAFRVGNTDSTVSEEASDDDKIVKPETNSKPGSIVDPGSDDQTEETETETEAVT